MTSLVTRHPLRLLAGDFDSLRRAMDHVFDVPTARARRRLSLAGSDAGPLPVDISEHDGDIIVRAAVPGFARDDIDVQLHDGELSITARRGEESDDQDNHDEQRYYRREIRHGAVSRRLTLPRAVHDAEVEAALTDGVLTVTISVPEQARRRRIEIR